MTVPHLPSRPTASAEPGSPWVRLDVRIGSARSVGHSVSGSEFTVGGAATCHLRLPGNHLPPLLARFDRTPDGLQFSRLATAFPILLNGEPLTGSDPVLVQHGDTVAIGSADITVSIASTGHLHPTFVPISPPPPSGGNANTPAEDALPGVIPFPLSQSDPGGEAARLVAEREELERYRAKLEEHARELEADRVLWYRRRQEIEAECPAMRSQPAPLVAASQPFSLVSREQELVAREQEVANARDELAAIRQELLTQYHARRDELTQMQESVRGATAELDQQRKRFDSELVHRQAELEAAWERDADARWQQLAEQFEHEVRSVEPRLTELRTRQTQLAAAFAELDSQRESLIRDRATLDSERTLEDTRRTEHDNLFAARHVELTRREEQILLDRAALDADRDRYTTDLLHLDRRRGELDERQQILDRRAVEVDQRVEQLVRDSSELEEQMRLADAEQAHDCTHLMSAAESSLRVASSFTSVGSFDSMAKAASL